MSDRFAVVGTDLTEGPTVKSYAYVCFIDPSLEECKVVAERLRTKHLGWQFVVLPYGEPKDEDLEDEL